MDNRVATRARCLVSRFLPVRDGAMVRVEKNGNLLKLSVENKNTAYHIYKAQCTILNDKFHGLVRYEEQFVTTHCNYVNGVQHGEYYYRDLFSIPYFEEGQYCNGKRHGIWLCQEEVSWTHMEEKHYYIHGKRIQQHEYATWLKKQQCIAIASCCLR